MTRIVLIVILGSPFYLTNPILHCFLICNSLFLFFEDLKDIKFVGDGTFILFSKKCVEVRPSGTDAINKSYSYGSDQWECIKFAKTFSSFEGERTSLHKKYILALSINRWLCL